MWYDAYRAQVDAITAAARKFYRLRYQMSDGGNLSVRLPDRDLMIVKAPISPLRRPVRKTWCCAISTETSRPGTLPPPRKPCSTARFTAAFRRLAR